MVDQALIRRYLRLRLELEPECVEDCQDSVEFGPRLSVQPSLFFVDGSLACLVTSYQRTRS